MGEEPIILPEELRPTPAGLFLHYCEHRGCVRWGSFGEPRGKLTRWVCREHRDQDE